MSELSSYLSAEKKKFLVESNARGGRAKGFRQWIARQYQSDALFFTKLVFDALMEAATKKWEDAPRKHGPDLFSIAGYTIPEFLTRPVTGYADADDTESDEDAFEKVDHQFATVQDLLDDATIKLRKAAQSAAAAELEMKAVDDARRRARGNMAAFLHDLMDQPTAPPGKSSDTMNIAPASV